MTLAQRWWIEHRTLSAIIASYSAAAWVSLALIGRLTLQPGLLATCIRLSELVLLWGAGLAVYAYANLRPVRCIARRLPGALTIAVLTAMQAVTFSLWKQTLPLFVPFVWDQRLYNWSIVLHGRPAWEWFRWIYDWPNLLTAVDHLYFTGWTLSTVLAFVATAWTRRRRLRQQYCVATALTWIMLGSFVSAAFGSGGPILFHLFAHEPDTYQTLRLTLAQHPSQYTNTITQYLVEAYRSGPLPLAGISAMPSLHVAQATLIALLLKDLGVRLWGWIWVAFVLLASVILGWHYALDGYVAILLTLVIWWFTSTLLLPRKSVTLQSSLRGSLRGL